jgi:type VI secretion system protein ImpL
MIRRFFRALWNALKVPWVLGLIVCLIFVLLVWFGGPYIAIADSKFLSSVVARLIATVCLIFSWGLFIAIYYSHRKKKELSNPEKASQAEAQLIDRGKFNEKADYIKDKLKTALRIITSSNFYGSTSRSRYALPWYLLIGTKSSGKTSLLLNSGLQFSLNEQADRHLYKLKSTEQIETLFSNQAVFIDIPGEYTGSSAGSEQNKLWTLLLHRILRIRPAKPINGIIVCVSIRDIMDTDAAKCTHLALILRERLSEILKRLHSYAPVYLVFTKCDAVPGFAQFFAHLNRPDREQIFGCPLVENTGLDTANIRDEIKEVMQTLNAQIISKIHQERDLVSRGDMFRFPQELDALGERIEDFIYEAFGPSRYHKPVLFRGFFFCSALSVQDVLAGSSRDGELSFQTGFQPSLGDYAKGFFILRLLQNMIIPEARLAGIDKERIWGLRLRRYGVQLASGALFLFALFCMGISFANNYTRIDNLNTRYQSFLEAQKQTITPLNSKAVLPELYELQKMTTIYDPNNDSMFSYGFGLYKGTIFDRASHKAYLQVLNSRLMPLLRKEATDKIDRSLANVAELKQALRAYLMMCQPEYLKSEALMSWLNRQWSERYHGDASTQQTLAQHMDYLIANGITPVNPDTALLERSRQALLKIPLAELAYQQMKDEASESGKPPFSFRNSLGDSISPFDGDTYIIPYLYTRNGYDEYCLKRCPIIITNLTTDSWIFGSNPITLSTLDIDKIYKDVRAMYFKDYTHYWAEAIKTLSIRMPQTLAEAAKVSNQLTSGISPVVLILRELKANTTLVVAQVEEEPLQKALLDQTQRAVGQKASQVGSGVGRAVAQQARTAAEETTQRALEDAQKDAQAVGLYFKPLLGLLDDNGNARQALLAAHDATVGIGSYFEKMGGDHNQRVLSALLEIADGKDSVLYTAEITAQKLPTPVKTWYEVVPSEGFKIMLNIAANNINQIYRDRVLSVYSRDLSPYYPLNSQASTDVNLENFSNFFRSGGVLDTFYDANLKPFINPNGTLKSIMGRTLPLSSTALTQLQRANKVQSAFFSSGRDVGISFMIEPFALDATFKQVDLASDGKTVSYWHGPVRGESYTWPLADGISSKASLTFTDLNGVSLRKDASGEWALFRIMQAGTIKRQDGNVCMIELQQNGKWAQFLIQFRNRLNPFDPSVCSFSLPGSLR